MQTNSRYTVAESDMLRNVSYAQTASEAAILWFLRAYELEHKRGATKEEVMLHARISERTFARAWPRLERAGLVYTEHHVSAAGLALAMTGTG